MKKKIVLVCLFACFIISGCSWIDGIDKSEFQEYLEKTYGEDKNFKFVKEDDCNWFELGYCYYEYTADNMNGKTFYVEGIERSGQNEFHDNYVTTLYSDKLNNDYYELFGNALDDTMEIRLDIEEDRDIPFVTYEEYKEIVNDKMIRDLFINVKIKTDTNISSEEDYDDEDLSNAEEQLKQFVNKNYDIEKLKTDVKNIIESKQLTNIKEVTFMADGCNENDMIISCNYEITLYEK